MAKIIERYFTNPPDRYKALFEEPKYCKEHCPFYSLCRGGAREVEALLGNLKNPLDPYCTRINREEVSQKAYLAQ